ncbi:MAG: hypothetical protein LZF63_00205 [Nitrosomonas sp.]|nr:hypothetical protein [Nitrosomonas sp.]
MSHGLKLRKIFLVIVMAGSLNAFASFLCFAEFNKLSIVHGFDDSSTTPNQLIEGSDNLLYGTTQRGGQFDGGQIFRISKNGIGYEVLHSFGFVAVDGIHPLSRVTEGRDGILYGTTNGGGKNFLGTIFKINKDGSGYSVLYDFSEANIGYHPQGALLVVDDYLYGTTSNCSNSVCRGSGTIFRIKKDGTNFSNLYIFKADRDASSEERKIGSRPEFGLVEGTDGFLYGTSQRALFKISKDGSDFEALHFFIDGIRYFYPVGDLVNKNGVFFGVTHSGGASNMGFIYRINEDGTDFSIIWNFINGGLETPTQPDFGLLLDKNETLYGVAKNLIYRINTDGTNFSVLPATAKRLRGRMVLSGTNSALIQGSDGSLYGVSYFNSPCQPVETSGNIYSLKSSIEIIFDWAESTYPHYFPSHEETQFLTPWSYRYYPATEIYLGINGDNNGIYVLGSTFGSSPVFIDKEDSVYGLIAASCE